MNQLKKPLYYAWISAVICLFILVLVKPDLFTPEGIARVIQEYSGHLLIVYVLISVLRGLFIIPSTPFVLVGIILFPDMPWVVFTISIIGIIIGSTLVYYFSDGLGFSKKLEDKYPKKIDRWHKRLNSPWASLIVIIWSFFPFVPTDVICFVAGIVKMPYHFLIAGVIIGEVFLVYIYVFYGSMLWNLL
jgi:uncharacterized membrane protein YdjX (TVP38/TMEM64 family)